MGKKGRKEEEGGKRGGKVKGDQREEGEGGEGVHVRAQIEELAVTFLCGKVDSDRGGWKGHGVGQVSRPRR